METATIYFIIFGAISGLTEEAGVLPDGPLNASIGGTVMFTTSLTPTETPFVSVTWRFSADPTPIIIAQPTLNTTGPEYEDRITLFTSTRSLELRNLKLSDSGEYSVDITPTGEAAKSGRTRLAVYAPVSNVTVTPSRTNLVEFNSSVSLSCSSSGSPNSFLWMNSSSEVTASDRVQLTDGGSTLTIVNVTRYDQGPYRCRAFNPVSDDISGPANLSVSYGPEKIKLLLSPSQQHYKKGSDISLICSTESRPDAQFTWFLNGNNMSDSGPELRLMNIQLSQSGSYSCQAFNPRTLRYQSSQPSFISVLEPVSTVTVTPNTTDLVEFIGSVSLSCSSSAPFLFFLWMNGSSEVTASDRVQLNDGGSILKIVNVTRYDQGSYRCRVFNPVSNQISGPANLSISYGPENVKLTLSQEHYEEGSDISLICSAESRPDAQFTWFLNGNNLSDTGPELKLMNIQLSQSGSYSCQAFNPETLRNQSSQPSFISVLHDEKMSRHET
ncbi:cell adhesion molecule CEACAM5-like [Odontesthes bonariensis]